MNEAQGSRTIHARQLADWLLRVAYERDRDAFARLYLHFAPRLKGYLIRTGADGGTAEELAQEVMLTVWQRAAQFDGAQAGVATWIYRIARNRRIDRLRREQFPSVDPNDPLLVEDTIKSTDEGIETAERDDTLLRAVARLPPEQAELVYMAFFEDISHRTIADTTRLPLGTVKSRLRLALARLRRELGETNEV